MLEEATDSIPLFSLEGRKSRGKLVSCFDGDTCHIVLEMDNALVKFNCRLIGIDTPEIHLPPNAPFRDELKAAAFKARDRLKELCQGIVEVQCFSWDKYGRLLVRLYNHEGKCVNDSLVEEGLAVKYDGGTKGKWAPPL